ncbi:YdeI/OmpD-associated family protein [Ornithinimicrobium sp. Arc0846-15]|nr:YdeI/OmpD-associated family protein [Ornithinimicrobium laminariae]
MGITQGGSQDRPATFFDDESDFRAWLEENHDSAEELWMGIYKKHVPDRGLQWVDAVPVALCFGWIDSVSQRIDDDARRQRWTPRRAGSIWSKVNVAHVERLTAQGLMHPAGLAAYERRSSERTGIYAFEQSDLCLSTAQNDLIQSNAAAWAFWREATPTYRKVVTAWILTAKREATRESRLQQLVDDSAAGRLVPPQRYGDAPRWLSRAAAAAAMVSEPTGTATDTVSPT